MDNKTINEYFECQCYSDEHRLVFRVEEDGEISASVFLDSWQPLYKKIWNAIKFVFGYKSKYGHFDSFIMRSEDKEKFKKLLTVSENREMLISARKYKEKQNESL